MIECQPGIYEVLLETDRGVTNKINIFIIPGNKGGRSLMIDTGCFFSGSIRRFPVS